MRNVSGIVGALLAICISQGISAATWYVDYSVSASGDGTSWETAIKEIQEGIDKATHGDTVIVAEGTYVENVKFNGKNIVLTSTDPLDPTVVAKTIIDGNQAGSVVTFSGTENGTCALLGFTIQNGYLLPSWDDPPIGGICGGTPDSHTHATIMSNRIIQGLGSGLANCDGLVRNSTISQNSAGEGGGLFCCNGLIENNVISDNSAEAGGGLIWCHGVIRNNVIADNWAMLGGGLFACHGTIRNNLIACNGTYYGDGGGLCSCGGTAENNTIVHNTANGPPDDPGRGGGLSNCHGTIRDCIIWSNDAAQAAQLYESSRPVHSCIEGGSAGDGNISSDPDFVDFDGPDNKYWTWEDNNWRLSASSACIDKGANEEWMEDAVDLDDNPRIWGGTVDVGAYEYGSWPFKILQLSQVQGGGAFLTWKTRPGDDYIVWWCHDLVAGGWTREDATIPSGGEQTTWSDPDTASAFKFYRIQIK